MLAGTALAWYGHPLLDANTNATAIMILRRAQQGADINSHIASDLAHTATGMYAWEAAQYIFYDFRLLCALMRGACPSALRVFARLRQRLPLISLTSRARRRSSVMHSENLELQTVPQRGAEHRSRIPTSVSEFDIGVGDALDHAADREDRPSPQPSPPSTARPYPKEGREWTRLTFFRFCNLLAKFDYLLLRFTTFASLLALLILLDLPSQTGSASAAPGSRFSETLTCEEWKVINIVAWVTTLAGFSFGNILLILRTIAVWSPKPDIRTFSISESWRSLPRLKLLLQTTFFPTIFLFIYIGQWLLLCLGAHRMSRIPVSEPGQPGCAFAPPAVSLSLASTVSVIHRKRALMPPGLGIGVAYGNNLGDPRLIITICAYFLAVDIFAFTLLVTGIARRHRDAPLHDRRGSHIPAPVEISVSHSVQATSFTAPFSPNPSNNFLTTEPQMIRSDRRNRANSSAASTISTVHFAPEPFKPIRSRSNTLEGASGTQTLQSSPASSSESSWRWIVYDVPARSRMWRIWIKEGLFWVLGIIIAKIGLLVCVVLNTTPKANSFEFQSMCMCMPVFVVVSIASGRLFLCISRLPGGEEDFMNWSPLPRSYTLHSGLREALDSELGLPSYVDHSQYFRRITRMDAMNELQTIGGSEWTEEAKRARREMKKKTAVVDDPPPAKARVHDRTRIRHPTDSGPSHHSQNGTMLASLKLPKSPDRRRRRKEAATLSGSYDVQSTAPTADISSTYTGPGPSRVPRRPPSVLVFADTHREVNLDLDLDLDGADSTADWPCQ